MDVAGVVIEAVVPQKRSAGDESRSAARNVEKLTVAIDQAGQGRQQLVGVVQIVRADSRQLSGGEAGLAVAHGQVIGRDRAGIIELRDADELALKSELEGMPAANVGGIVLQAVSVGGAALRQQRIDGVAE